MQHQILQDFKELLRDSGTLFEAKCVPLTLPEIAISIGEPLDFSRLFPEFVSFFLEPSRLFGYVQGTFDTSWRCMWIVCLFSCHHASVWEFWRKVGASTRSDRRLRMTTRVRTSVYSRYFQRRKSVMPYNIIKTAAPSCSPQQHNRHVIKTWTLQNLYSEQAASALVWHQSLICAGFRFLAAVTRGDQHGLGGQLRAASWGREYKLFSERTGIWNLDLGRMVPTEAHICFLYLHYTTNVN